MLATTTHEDTLLLTMLVGIICKTIEIGVGLVAIRRYSSTHIPPYNTSPKDGLGI